MRVSCEERVGFQELLLEPPAGAAEAVVAAGCVYTTGHVVGQGADAKATLEDRECLELAPTQTDYAGDMSGTGGPARAAAEYGTESGCGRGCCFACAAQGF